MSLITALLTGSPAADASDLETGRVIAQVEDAGSGNGLGGIEVTLFDVATAAPVATATSNDDDAIDYPGAAVFDGVAPGEYVAHYEDPAGVYAPQWSGGTPSALNAEALTVVAALDTGFTTVSMSRATGRVLAQVVANDSGEPVGGIEVTLFDVATAVPAATAVTSDEEDPDHGTAVFDAVAPGAYVAYYEDPSGAYGPQWSGGVSTALNAEVLTVVAAVDSGFTTATLSGAEPPAPDGPGTLSWLVTDADTAEAVEGIVVTIFDAATMVEVAQRTTASGPLTIPLPAGTYVVHHGDPGDGYESVWYGDETLVTATAPVIINTGATTASGQALSPWMPEQPPPLPSGRGALRGTINRLVPADDGGFDVEPVTGATVTIIDAETGSTFATATTDDAGMYDVEVPAPRSYLVVANDGTRFDVLTVTRVERNQAAHTVYHLDRLVPSATGTATITRTVPAGVPITVVDLVTGTAVASGVSTGSFEATVPAPGVYGLFATVDPVGRYRCAWLLPSTPPERCDSHGYSIRTISVAPGEVNTGVFPLPEKIPQFTAIRGTVTGSGGVPLEGVTVRVFDAETGEPRSSAVTDASGFYSSIATVEDRYVVRYRDPSGQYRSEFYAEGGSVVGAAMVVVPDTNPVAIPVELDPVVGDPVPGPAAIVGEVRDTDFAPLAGIEVRLVDAETLGVVASQATDADGRFDIEVLAPADVFVAFRDPAGMFQNRWYGGIDLHAAFPVDLEPGRLESINAELSPLAGALFGQVRGRDDFEGIVGATVTAIDVATGKPTAATVADEFGDYEVMVPQPGTYVLHVSDTSGNHHPTIAPGPGRLPLSFPQPLGPDDRQQLDVELDSAWSTIFGEVRAEDDFEALAGIELIVLDPATLEVVDVLTSDGDGRFDGRIPAPGSFILQFRDPSGVYESRFHPSGSRVTDAFAEVTSSSGFVEVRASLDLANRAPTLTSATCAPVDPIALGSAASVTATLADPDDGDEHTLTIDWGDGTTEAVDVVPGTVGATHRYSEVGVFQVSLLVEDAEGATGDAACADYIVVYDPDGGFVTGGGWFDSPAGAYVADPSLSDRAGFGFVSKYRKGAHTPSGTTEFEFQAAGMQFVSSSYEWLVVAGSRAQFKGTGTINDEGTYRFLLTAIDGDVAGGDGTDRFRIKIWDPSTGDVVYDNELGTLDGDNPSTAIGGGSIVIHEATKRNR